MKYNGLQLIAAVGEGKSDRRWLTAVIRHVLSVAPGEISPCEAEILQALQRENFLFWSQLPKVEAALKLASRTPVGGRDGPKSRDQEKQHLLQFSRVARAKGWLKQGGCLLLFIRDLDESPERRAALLEAKTQTPEDFQAACAIATPNQCIEAWLFLGLASMKGTAAANGLSLSFDPFTRPEHLSHKDGSKTKISAKEILEQLIGCDHDKEEDAAVAGWQAASSAARQTTFLPELKGEVEHILAKIGHS